jgi:hypothetical protein
MWAPKADLNELLILSQSSVFGFSHSLGQYLTCQMLPPVQSGLSQSTCIAVMPDAPLNEFAGSGKTARDTELVQFNLTFMICRRNIP